MFPFSFGLGYKALEVKKTAASDAALSSKAPAKRPSAGGKVIGGKASALGKASLLQQPASAKGTLGSEHVAAVRSRLGETEASQSGLLCHAAGALAAKTKSGDAPTGFKGM